MFVSIDALYNVLSLKIQRNELFKDPNVHWYLRKSDKNTTNYSIQLLRTIPRVTSDVLYTISCLWVSLKYVPNHVFCVVASYFGNRVLSIQNFLV